MSVPTNLIPTKITGLPEYTGTSQAGYFPYVLEGTTYKVQFSSVASSGEVPPSRTITAGTGLVGGGDLSANRIFAIANGGVGANQLDTTGVVAGVYGNGSNVPTVTVDANGRVTSVTTSPVVATGYVPESRTITAGTGLIGGGSLAGNVTLSLNISSATPQALGNATAGVSTAAARGDHVHPAVNLSDMNQTQGALPLGRGGTGDALSPVAGAVVYSTGSKFALTNPGTPGQVLVSGGTDEPQWLTISGTGTVTSVNASGGSTGMTFTGGPITEAGTLTLGGASANTFTGATTLTAGTLGHGRVAASVQGGDKEGLRYALGMQQMAEKGISATSPNAGASSYVADRDGFRQGSLNGSLRMPINKDWRLDASMLHSNGVSRFDEYNGTGTDSRTVVRAAVLQAGFTGQVSRDWLTQVSIGQSEDTHNPIRSIYYTPVRSTLSNLTWQNTLATRAGAVLAGAEFSRQEIEQSPPPAQPRRDTRSVFAGLNGQSGMQLWQANLRRDSSNAYGDRNTGLLSYGLQFTPEWRASASWGQTFVAPSFGDLYDAYNGNPNLRPEHGVNRELSLGWTQEQRQAKLTWFDNRIRDLLAYDSVSDKVQNLSAARLRGWTLSGKVRVAGANLRASLDGLDPRAEDTGKLLVRRARQQASLGADWQQGAWRWGASLLHVGERYDDAANTAAKRLPAYSTVDLFAQWRFARDFDLQMKVNNATDRYYETVYGYNQPGRTAYLTLRWQTR